MLAMPAGERLSRYGEDPAPRPYGVETISIESFQSLDSPQTISTRVVEWLVESVRHTWEILRTKAPKVEREVFAERTESDQPWTCVNNRTLGNLPQTSCDHKHLAHRGGTPLFGTDSEPRHTVREQQCCEN